MITMMEATFVKELTGILPSPADIPLWELALFVILLLIVGIRSVSQEGTLEIEAQASDFKEHKLNSVDFYASMDPVPNGPILLPTPDNIPNSKGPVSIEVCNQFSVIGDHTSYMENRDEFLPVVVDMIAKYSGTDLKLHRSASDVV